MKKIKLIIVFCLLLVGCGDGRLSYPITITTIKAEKEGCSLRLDDPKDNNQPVVWTRPSPEQCQFRVGDVLK